jgi:WD40 repeat protein
MPKSLIRNLLPQSEFTCFVVSGLFSDSECAELLTPEIKASFQKAIMNYPTYYRNNDRQVVDSTALSEFLFEKVKPYLPQSVEINSSIPIENGKWALVGLNSRLRFCRYQANQYFNRHLDGIHYHSAQTQSKLTFMIYLNDATDFEGGRTLFYKTKDSEAIWATYTPQKGDLIVFDHNVWHEGEVLKSGEKFILRSDILYSKEVGDIEKLPFSTHLGYIWALLKLDDNTILSGGRDKQVNVWSQKGELQQSLKGHQNSILCLEKMNGNVFLTGSRDQKIIVWERKHEKFSKKNTVSIHSALVLSVCKLTESLFASAGGNGNIQICSLQGELVRTWQGHENWVWQILSMNDETLISCSEDASIRI